jgi:hypothetical protein
VAWAGPGSSLRGGCWRWAPESWRHGCCLASRALCMALAILTEEWPGWPVMQGLTLAALASWAQFSVWLLAPFYLVSLGDCRREPGVAPLGSRLRAARRRPVAGWLTDHITGGAPMISDFARGRGAGHAGAGGQDDAASPWAWPYPGGIGAGVRFEVPNLAQVMGPSWRVRRAGGLAHLGRTLRRGGRGAGGGHGIRHVPDDARVHRGFSRGLMAVAIIVLAMRLRARARFANSQAATRRGLR